MRPGPWGAIGVVLLLLLAGCTSRTHARGRVLLVGIDGATLRVIRPLLEQNRLPHLARIARAGVYGPLTSIRPLFSGPIWTSIATGKKRHKHGISGFTLKDEHHRDRLYRSSDRRVHALWNIASDAGLNVAVVNWWNTFPPERIRGIMVSDHALPGQTKGRAWLFGAKADSKGSVVFPIGWNRKLRGLLADDSPLGEIENPFLPFLYHNVFPRWVGRSQLLAFRKDAQIARIALAAEREIRPDLLMVYFKGIDNISHLLWGTLEPAHLYPPRLQPSAAERVAGAEALYSYYEHTDALIGRLVERYGADDLVLVVSDHGFEAGTSSLNATGVHKSPKAQQGVIFARGRGIPRGLESGTLSVIDITPTILAWLGMPTAEDMDGAPAPFLELERVQRIASYDTRPLERLGSGFSGAEEAILEELRALGYFD